VSDTVEPTYDTPDTDDVLQEDERPLEAIAVSIEGVVRTEEMPSRRGDFRNVILRAGSMAQAICQDDPRRKRLILWPTIQLDTETVLVCVGVTEADANDFRGAFLLSGANAVARYETTYSGKLWARPCVINDTAGIVTSIAASTQDAILSVVQEQWAN